MGFNRYESHAHMHRRLQTRRRFLQALVVGGSTLGAATAVATGAVPVPSVVEGFQATVQTGEKMFEPVKERLVAPYEMPIRRNVDDRFSVIKKEDEVPVAQLLLPRPEDPVTYMHTLGAKIFRQGTPSTGTKPVAKQMDPYRTYFAVEVFGASYNPGKIGSEPLGEIYTDLGHKGGRWFLLTDEQKNPLDLDGQLTLYPENRIYISANQVTVVRRHFRSLKYPQGEVFKSK